MSKKITFWLLLANCLMGLAVAGNWVLEQPAEVPMIGAVAWLVASVACIAMLLVTRKHWFTAQ